MPRLSKFPVALGIASMASANPICRLSFDEALSRLQDLRMEAIRSYSESLSRITVLLADGVLRNSVLRSMSNTMQLLEPFRKFFTSEMFFGPHSIRMMGMSFVVLLWLRL